MVYELVNYKSLLSLQFAKREYSSIYLKCGLAQEGRNVAYFPEEGGILKCYRQVDQIIHASRGISSYPNVQYQLTEKESTYILTQEKQPVGADLKIMIESVEMLSLKTTSGLFSYVFPRHADFEDEEYFQFIKTHILSDAERAIEALDAQLFLNINGNQLVTRSQWDHTNNRFNSVTSNVTLGDEPTYRTGADLGVDFKDTTKTPQEKFRAVYDIITKHIIDNANSSGATSALSPDDNSYFICSDPVYFDILKVAMETTSDLKVHNNRSFTVCGITFVSIIYQYLKIDTAEMSYTCGLLVNPKALYFGFMRQKLSPETLALAEALNITTDAASAIGLYTEEVITYDNPTPVVGSAFRGMIYQPYAVGGVVRSSPGAITPFGTLKSRINNHPA